MHTKIVFKHHLTQLKPCEVPVTYTIQTPITAASNGHRRQVSVTTHLYNKHAHVHTTLYNGFQK
jgi:hypothetical protein